ncbi:MAG: RDD family protein [Actinomycetota bacterium]
MTPPTSGESSAFDPAQLDFADGLQRIGSGAVDWAVALAVAGAAASIAGRVDGGGDGSELVAATIAVWFVHLVVYPATTGMAGLTPGKYLFGIRVITTDGVLPPGYRTSFVRVLPLWAGVVPFVGAYVVVLLLVANALLVSRDPLHRSVYDRVGKTYVVRP